jgi:hypothetical protein
VRNLQIVNGGQTTASLYHTVKKDKASLKGIYIQAKLSVIPPSQIDIIVPLISRYANSQNKVSDADFYANDPFHIRIEELSRNIWVPAINGNHKQTKWFYERARGQYLDAKGRESTSARKRQFEMIYPNKQKFTKTDLAKYENTWMQLPNLVSMGAQKNFNHFSIQLRQRSSIEINNEYFQHLIAKALLFKCAERVISDMRYGGYRANIVTYTLAWLSYHTSQRIDLNSIWMQQDISVALLEAIRSVSTLVQKIIINPPNTGNVTEWCKRKECWEAVRNEKISISDDLQRELIDNNCNTTKSDSPDSHIIAAISKISAQTWFDIAKWAKETNNLQSWQRSLSLSIGKKLSRGYPIRLKQAQQGQRIIDEVKIMGFNFDT